MSCTHCDSETAELTYQHHCDGLVAELREHIDGRPLIVSISGGKDSTATWLFLRELGLDVHACIHMDTGWEHKATVEYLRTTVVPLVGELKVLRAEFDLPNDLERIAQGFEERLGFHSAMVRLLLKKGMFASRRRRFCTQQLKVFPSRDYFATLEDEPISVVGIRAAESASRAKYPEWEESDLECEIWRPLLRFSEKDVIDIHTAHGVRPNPLYLEKASRVGCWPCVFARKAELKWLSEFDPDRVAILRDLEEVVGDLAEARWAKKGERRDTWTRPTWFQNPTPARRDLGWECITCGETWGPQSSAGIGTHTCPDIVDDPLDPCGVTRSPVQKVTKHDGSCWPIDRVIQWSITAWGGRQFELFAAGENERGCLRWGLCDTGVEPLTNTETP
ncbi:MAG: phosphoadenosine phosphosulfate reductase family protein [Proteobacteria bacterium]|nr:phosphoadenosine phosphosulfate reductase family protein [Pseudomonadota bacterium]